MHILLRKKMIFPLVTLSMLQGRFISKLSERDYNGIRSDSDSMHEYPKIKWCDIIPDTIKQIQPRASAKTTPQH